MKKVFDSRQACLKIAHTFLDNKDACHYSQYSNRWAWRWRPYPMWPYFGDCSSTVTAVCYYAHGNDPNGLNWAGGNTASILNNANNKDLILPKRQSETCDFVTFGIEADGYTPKHIVMLMQPGTVNDPICFSMGQEGDPNLVPYSVLLGIGAPIFIHNHTDVPVR